MGFTMQWQEAGQETEPKLNNKQRISKHAHKTYYQIKSTAYHSTNDQGGSAAATKGKPTACLPAFIPSA